MSEPVTPLAIETIGALAALACSNKFSLIEGLDWGSLVPSGDFEAV